MVTWWGSTWNCYMDKLIFILLLLISSAAYGECEVFSNVHFMDEEIQWVVNNFDLKCSLPVSIVYTENIADNRWAEIQLKPNVTMIVLGPHTLKASSGDRKSVLIHEFAHVEQLTRPISKRSSPYCQYARDELEAYQVELKFADKTKISEGMRKDIGINIDRFMGIARLACLGRM